MQNPSIDVDLIVEALGGDVKASEFFEITRQGVAKWRKQKKIPNARFLHLKAARPDLFDHPTPTGTEQEPGMAFGEFGEPRTGLERRDDDRRTEQGPDFGELGEPRDGDRRQEDRRRDSGENEAAA